ncbi:MAG: hypothetical protein IJ367_03910, partial [Clostridia bacterium]|nr:hypothetical protein [Clostridia bacterium]
MKKRLIALIVCALCILMFSGCKTEGVSLISAFQKEFKITSMKTTDMISAQMEVALPEELKEDMDPFYLQSLLNMLSAFHIEGTTLYQKSGSTLTEKANLSLISEDISFDTEIYTNVKNDGILTVFKIPTPAKALLPEEYTNA